LSPVRVGDARFAVWCADSHPNVDEVEPQDRSFLNGQTPVLRVADSREGWVEAIRTVMLAAFENRDQIVDVSDVRERGALIRTFGGIAAGPGPLVQLLRAVWEIIRGAAGRQLRSVEALDITNHIGKCIKAGNVRRSALIVLGDADDQDFRDAKKDYEAVKSHRHTSNNSIVFRSWEQIDNFDWHSLANDVVDYGEPGILNLPLAWRTDPGVSGVNPCGEQCLEDRESCNLAEAFPAKFEKQTDPATAFRLLTRYAMRQRLTPLTDARSQAVGARNNRIGVGLGGICDFEWTGSQLAQWFNACRHEADEYAEKMGVRSPITTTTVKPSGTISLLNGSSPGIHAPYAPYYIRRTRHAKNDPLVPALMEAGVPFEQDMYDSTGNTLVFSFPTKALHTRHTVVSETLRDQFERQAAVQEWWADNAVSSTISFEPHEREQLPALLKEFVPKLKSTSVLSKAHGYDQPPYEEVSRETYESMAAGINHDHQLVHGGDFEIEECRSGVCPIR
jgi:ribonucleoside-triphosphate reductase